tara:strand:- start:53 stop:1000 length:948 start_codon:yes stop_codon:yes gene_type:complete
MNNLIILLTLSILLSANASKAQTYQLNSSTSTYTNISNPNLLDKTLFDLVNNVKLFTAIPIGFSFVADGINYDSIRISENGYVFFEIAGQTGFGISIYDCDLKDFHDTSSFSPINYTLEGAIGNRIFKCEFNNSGFFQDQEDDDYINFQLWIYEACSDFEVRIGPSSINSNVFLNGNSAPYIGYAIYQPFSFSLLSGSPTSPVLNSGSSGAAMNSQPAEGTVYNFSDCATGINFNSLSKVNVYPNPSSNFVHVELGTNHTYTALELIDVNGRTIAHYKLEGQLEIEVDLKNYYSGIYLLQLKSDQRLKSMKIIKE